MTKKFALALACLCLLPLKSFAMPSDPMGTTGGGDPSSLAFSDQFTGELAAITGAELDGQGTLVLKVAADSSTSDQTSVRRVPVKEVKLRWDAACRTNIECKGALEPWGSSPGYFRVRPSFLNDEQAKTFPVIFVHSNIAVLARFGIIQVLKTRGGELIVSFDIDRFAKGILERK